MPRKGAPHGLPPPGFLLCQDAMGMFFAQDVKGTVRSQAFTRRYSAVQWANKEAVRRATALLHPPTEES